MAIHESHYTYDVFLSFRGEDTRQCFTGHLFHALFSTGINTFMDEDGLKGGDQISDTLVKAIEESRISIVVFSQNYASSRWCLDELVKIVECMKTKNQTVLPIFYRVDPSDVRHQRNSYNEAMTKHESRFRNEYAKVQNWRSALSQVADLKGFHFKTETRSEFEFIKDIVKQIDLILPPKKLHVGDHIIGHQSRMEEVQSLLDIGSNNMVCMMGIHGAGGIGKTILAKSLYNLIVHQFECAVFLEDVRETSNNKGLIHLQEAILSKLLKEKMIKLNSISEGVTMLERNLCHKKLLLVLDDVNDLQQLNILAGKCNWFGSGSRIIITTRDKHLLIGHEVEKRYEMKELNDDEGLQLFCWKAFKKSQPEANYENVSKHAIHYAKGLPLALEVIGSNMVGKSPKECECTLEQYERFPEKKIQDILKVSYDCLQDNARQVFLDIAFFFKGYTREYVENILERGEFYPTYNIGILVDKSLIRVDQFGHIRMHDLIQDMGKEVVRQKAPGNPGKRSRLCYHEDIVHVLTEDLGSSNIEGIILDPPKGKEIEIEWNGGAFKKMIKLRILIIRNVCFLTPPNYLPNSLWLLEWRRYPFGSLPQSFSPRNMVDLQLPDSHFKLKKEKLFPGLKHLIHINFSSCQFLTHIPDVSGISNLETLSLSKCDNLTTIHHSIGFLKKLKRLNVGFCMKLKHFPTRIWLPSLEYLDFSYCTSFKLFPNIEGVMDKLSEIDLSFTQIKELPHSVHSLKGLKNIIMLGCKRLRNLPKSLFIFPLINRIELSSNDGVQDLFRRLHNSYQYSPLRELNCSHCHLTDEDLYCILSCFPNLERLRVAGNDFVVIPTRIKKSTNLIYLDLDVCWSLKEIPELPSSIKKVMIAGCLSLTLETSAMLWNKIHKKDGLIMHYNSTPTWFDCYFERGGIVSFWIREKLPVLGLSFFFEHTSDEIPTCDIIPTIHFYINGTKVDGFGACSNYSLQVQGDVVVLFDVRSQVRIKEWPILRMLVSDWIYLEDKSRSCIHWIMTHSGAYMDNRDINIDDIQFTCPNQLKQKASIIQNQPKKQSSKGRKNKMAKRISAQFQRKL